MAKTKIELNKKRFVALTGAALYIVNCGLNEHRDYVNFCEENGLDPAKIGRKQNQEHVYAQALVGLGLKFQD